MILTGHGAENDLSRRRAWILLAGVVGCGACLRMYGLSSLSFWLDEYLSGMAYGKAPSASAYFQLVNSYGGHGSPIFYGLHYYWGLLVGHNPTACRLLPLLFGVSSLLLMYLVGSVVAGRRAGLLAALIFALFPVHVWYSHAFRTYAMTLFFSLISIYALLRALRGEGKGWWILSVASNVLIVYVHVIEALFIFAQGCFLLVHFRKQWRPLILWTLAHAVALFPWVGLIASHGSTNISHQMEFNSPLITSFFTNAGVAYMTVPAPAWAEHIPGVSPGEVVDSFLYGQAGLAVFLWVLTGWFVLRTVVGRERQLEVRLLAFLAVVPALALGGLTYLFSLPFLRPRYIMHSQAAMLLLLAVAITRLPARWMRVAGTGIVAGALALQLAVFIPASVRMDWKEAGRHLSKHAAPGDILICNTELTANIIRFNSEAARKLPAFWAGNFQATCDAVNVFLSVPRNRERTAWLLYDANWPGISRKRLEDMLRACGYTFEYAVFTGHDHLGLYGVRHLSDPGGGEPAAPGEDPFALTRADLESQLPQSLAEALGAGFGEDTRVLRRLLPDAPPYDMNPVVLSNVVQLFETGNQEGVALFCQLTEEDPLMMPLAKAVVAAASGDTESAKANYEAVASQKDRILELLDPFFVRLFVENDLPGATSEAEYLEQVHAIGSTQLRQMCAYLSHPKGPWLPLGLVAVTHDGQEGSCFAIEEIDVERLDRPAALVNLAETLALMGAPEKAEAAYRRVPAR